MTPVKTPTNDDLIARRRALLKATQLSEIDLRRLGAAFELNSADAEILREIEDIDYLLGA